MTDRARVATLPSATRDMSHQSTPLPADTRDLRLQAHIPNQLGHLLLHTYLKAFNLSTAQIVSAPAVSASTSGSAIGSIEAVIALNTEAASFKANDLKIPLHYAKDLHHVRAVLSCHPTGVKSLDRNGRTPLHIFLMDLDAYSKARCNEGGNSRLTEDDLVEICTLLSRTGTDGSHDEVLTMRDREGMTPLHHAIASESLPSTVLMHIFNLCRRSALISIQNSSTTGLIKLQKQCHNRKDSTDRERGSSSSPGRMPLDVVIAFSTPTIDVTGGEEEVDREALFGVTVIELMVQRPKQPPSYYDEVLRAVVAAYPFLSQIKTFKRESEMGACATKLNPSPSSSRSEQLFYPLYIAIQCGCSAVVAEALLHYLPYRSAREKCQLTRLTAAHLCVLSNNVPVLRVILKLDPLLSLLYSMKVAAVKHRSFPCLRLLLRCHITVMKIKANKLMDDIDAAKVTLKVREEEEEGLDDATDPNSDILSLSDDLLLAIDEDDSAEYLNNDQVNNASAPRDFCVASNVTNIAAYQRQVETDTRSDWRCVNRFQNLLFNAIIHKAPPDAMALLLELYVECNVYQQDFASRLAAAENSCVVAAPPLHAIFQVHSGDVEAIEGQVYVLTRHLPCTAAVIDYYGDSALHIAVQRFPLRHRLFQYLLLANPGLGVQKDQKGKLAIEYFPGLFAEKSPAGDPPLEGGATFITGGTSDELEAMQLPLAALLLYCLPVPPSGRGRYSEEQHKHIWTHVVAECNDRYGEAVKCITQNFPEPRLLAFAEDHKGHCYAIDIATPACKRHLLASMYFLGAYGFKALAPPPRALGVRSAMKQALVADVPMALHLLRFADRFDDEGGLSKQCGLAALLFYRGFDSFLFDKRMGGVNGKRLSPSPSSSHLGNPPSTNPPSAQPTLCSGDIHQRILDMLRRRGRLVASHNVGDDPYYYSECLKSRYGLDPEAYRYCNIYVFESGSEASEVHATVSSLEGKHQYYLAHNLYPSHPSPAKDASAKRSPSKQALLSPSGSAGFLHASRPHSAASRPSSAASRAREAASSRAREEVSRPSSADQGGRVADAASALPSAAHSRDAKLPVIAPVSRRPLPNPTGHAAAGLGRSKGKGPATAPKNIDL